MTAFALTHDLPTAASMRRQYVARAEPIADRLDGVAGLRPMRPEAGMFVLNDCSRNRARRAAIRVAPAGRALRVGHTGKLLRARCEIPRAAQPDCIGGTTQ